MLKEHLFKLDLPGSRHWCHFRIYPFQVLGAGSQLLEAWSQSGQHCQRHKSHVKNLFPVTVIKLAEDCAMLRRKSLLYSCLFLCWKLSSRLKSVETCLRGDSILLFNMLTELLTFLCVSCLRTVCYNVKQKSM